MKWYRKKPVEIQWCFIYQGPSSIPEHAAKYVYRCVGDRDDVFLCTEPGIAYRFSEGSVIIKESVGDLPKKIGAVIGNETPEQTFDRLGISWEKEKEDECEEGIADETP